MKMLLLFFPIVLFAAISQPKDDGIELLKLACKDPGAVHNQIPPGDIKVTCDDTRITWKETSNPDEMEFKNKRTVCSRAVTSKPNVKAPKVCMPCDWPDSPFSCAGWKEVEETSTMEFSVTCDQLMAWENVGKFCQTQMLVEINATDGKILEAHETGKMIKVCGLQNFKDGIPMSADWTPIKK